ncbi:MAG TPA: hypothetical protein VI589_12205, partial [Vicinamibacteria bacterium]
MRLALPLATALASAILALACSSAPSDPVRATLLALEEAGEARDADRFASHLAGTFRGAGTGLVGLDKAAASAALRRYFAAYESVSLTV